MATDSEFDIVVAGAGHNSLVTAAYLSKAGLRCLVLEHQSRIGGNTMTEELTLPGFLHDTCSTAHNVIQSNPMLRDDELSLRRYGLEFIMPDPVVHMPFPDGRSITQWRDIERTTTELARFSLRDAEAYRRLIAEWEEIAPVFDAATHVPVGWGPPLAERLNAHPGGRIWNQRIARSAWDVIRVRFESEYVRAFLLWMAFMTMVPPDQPNSGRLAWALVAGRQRWSWAVPRGGSQALANALAHLIVEHGGKIRTGMSVTGLIVEDGVCRGVTCADRSAHRARRGVVSTVHVKHLVEMASAETWGPDFMESVSEWQPGVSLYPAHYAVTEPLVVEGPYGAFTPSAIAIMPSVDHALQLGGDVARGLATENAPSSPEQT